jgi:hypothetical protein
MLRSSAALAATQLQVPFESVTFQDTAFQLFNTIIPAELN